MVTGILLEMVEEIRMLAKGRLRSVYTTLHLGQAGVGQEDVPDQG